MRRPKRTWTDIVDPLNPRDAFYGGRVNATKLLVKTESITAKIKYVDFTSLYPDINKNGVYPVGHPTIFTENIDPDVSSYFGLIQCDVLAPRGLYHAVLPFKCHNKLMFALCRTCAQETQQPFCHHADEQMHLHRDVGESGIVPGRGDGVQAREDSRSVAFSRENEYVVSGVH